MAASDTGVSLAEQQPKLVQELSNSVANLALQDEASQTDPTDLEKAKQDALSRPLMIYTPVQILYLHSSPLVQPPKGMPDLKDWFGTENEQNINKKESETSLTVNSARDRRFRRELEDETTSRPSFRPALSQPSQMGNFKHQSTRTTDRDRDARDREGHEHLRNLSDKYDRDRLGSNARNKDRDTAPHLTAGTSRLVGQSGSTTSRRTDGRDSGKRRGEGDDWRRGSERVSRDDRSDTTRRDREDRERPRSRVRDSSRLRRDPSAARRDRDRDRAVRDRDRDLDRDLDKDEDPRRWRDDGKREERMATRRDRERDRDRTDRPHREYDSYRPGMDDSRGKRQLPRDRKPNGVDEKERDDRRDREREKEKEPAWMDTYIPSPSSGAILSGKGGELDEIQAWKKDMKKQEKQEREKTATHSAGDDSSKAPLESGLAGAQNGLDEIQMFRMLMKQEEEKKKKAEGQTVVPTSQGEDTIKAASSVLPPPSTDVEKPNVALKSSTATNISVADGPNALLSMLTQASSASNSTPPLEPSRSTPPGLPDQNKQPTSRLFPIPQTSSAKPLAEPSPASSNQLNPPPGSRLLAFGARSPSATNPKPQTPLPTSSQESSSILPNHQIGPHVASLSPVPKPEFRPQPTFSPFEELSGPNSVLQETNDSANLPQINSSLRRVSAERVPPPLAENGAHLDAALDPSANVALASSKGSRFAKFFDGNKSRDPAIARAQPSMGTQMGLQPVPRPDENLVSNSPINLNTDNWAMMEIFNMLNNSIQGRSMNGVNQPLPAMSSGNGPFGQQQAQNNLQMLQPQLQHQPQILQNSRLESLYDSRLDDRSFVPDGMVPGLRSAPPRGQDNGGMFPDPMDDPLHFARQRMPSQQRGPEHMFPAQVPMFAQQPGRNAGLPLQQPQFRGGPSPISLQSQIQNAQRLPPGLANLGGRPPHEPNQFLSGMGNMQNAGLLSALHNGLPQQPFNNIPGSNNLGFGGPPIRVPPGPSPIQNSLTHSSIGLGHPNNMDMRLPNQAQLMGVGGVRGAVGFNPQQVPGQMQPLLGIRQQQPPILPPHPMAPGLPAHLQQQGLPPTNPQNPDLMALLMGGPNRE